MIKKFVTIFLLTLMITAASAAAINFKTTLSEENENKLVLVRIYIDQNLDRLPRDLELVGSKVDEWVEFIISEDRLDELNALEHEKIILDLKEHENSVRGAYHTLSEIEDILEDIANNYPDITDLYSIATTYEGREVWCLEISDNPGADEGEPGVFFMGLHHAREWPTAEICLYIADQLTSQYGSNPTIKDLVDNRRIWLVTCVNPDGYYFCHDQGNDWRKNRRPVTGGIGIDLNRNYAGSSNGDPWGAWGSVGTGSISNNPDTEVYCGPSPFSEIETQAVRDIFLENDICASISWHTHGELVLIPWGYSFDNPPDDPYITQVGQQIASKITRQSGSGTYFAEKGADLYPTTGDTDDWAYGYAHNILGRPTFAYTIEACSSFQPSASYLDQIVAENFDGALYLLEEADNIMNTVYKRVIPPEINDMQMNTDGDYTVTWEETNPDANPSKFQLDELIRPFIKIDDVESGTGYWDFNGFSLSTKRYHSGHSSYKSGNGNEQVYSMTTIDPIPVPSRMNLSFWCWYDIEKNWDMAFVEVSTNGRSYNVLDSYTGASNSWEHKQYILDDYAGESIFIRFRYITDQNTFEEGFFVDDITPVVDWDYITTLSDTITNNYYEITDKQDGEYYYRVKGYNDAYEWGDFSTLKKITVEIGENDPPFIVNIDGPANGKAGISHDYIFTTTDPNEHNIYYYIEWGDGEVEDWTGPYLSGEELKVSHTWAEQGRYIIRAKAKDLYNAEGPWGTLSVTMPRSRTADNFLQIFLKKYPLFFSLMQSLLSF
jgi:carboxypeptidase T